MAKISVIVPVYNTEKYLHRCIDSILAQTYNDFELLLIDDGSTDSSGEICEEYSWIDGRITVIHQENKRQGAARNAGLDWIFANSESEWIAFVDSDDWISKDYLDVLLRNAENNNSEISTCGFYEAGNEMKIPFRQIVPGGGMMIITPEYYYSEMNMLSAVPWGKLFAKHIWSNVRFPEVVMHEDELIMYKVVFTQNTIPFAQDPLYYYYINSESTTRSSWTPARLTALKAKEEQIQFMLENGYETAFNKAVYNFARGAEGQICQIDSGKYPKEKKKLIRRLRRHLRKYRKTELLGFKNNHCTYRVAYPLLDVIVRFRDYILPESVKEEK